MGLFSMFPLANRTPVPYNGIKTAILSSFPHIFVLRLTGAV